MTQLVNPTLMVPGHLGAAISATLERLEDDKSLDRLWQRDPSLWKTEPGEQRIIKHSLGWLSVARDMLGSVSEVTSFVDQARRSGFTHAVVLGMGGSSLCPDVCRATFGTAPGYLELHVLDSTVPASVGRMEQSVDLARTLFLVSSKSGGTVEPLSFFKYFHERVRAAKGDRASENFVAITDPGTSLEKLATEKSFRRIFHGHPKIGGRYSALSNFGMVPAALAGIDVRAMLERAERMAAACRRAVPENPGLTLGVALAEAARASRDKVTFVISPGIETLADWAEQLIAESTGKEGKGLVPVAGEELADPTAYGNDRIFVYLRLVPQTPDSAYADDQVHQKLHALERAGHPVVMIEVPDKLDLGAEFFRWEVATATAGALLGINAFDQPNVQESKDNTNRLLAEFRSQGRLPEATPLFEASGVRLYARLSRRASRSLREYLSSFLGQARPGDYVALLAYVDSSPEHAALLSRIRLRVRDRLRLATTLGYGPRFLHSTGQLHKGGPNTGVFVQITAEDFQDLAIPSEPYSFSTLKRAQALGDLESLQTKGRRVIRLHLSEDSKEGLTHLASLL